MSPFWSQPPHRRGFAHGMLVFLVIFKHFNPFCLLTSSGLASRQRQATCVHNRPTTSLKKTFHYHGREWSRGFWSRESQSPHRHGQQFVTCSICARPSADVTWRREIWSCLLMSQQSIGQPCLHSLGCVGKSCVTRGRQSCFRHRQMFGS